MSSLKKQNSISLAALLMANFVAFSAVLRGESLLNALRTRSLGGLGDLLPAGLTALVVGFLTSQLSPQTKARLVFLRWQDPLPGCRAFSHYARADARVDFAALTKMLGAFPTGPSQQNALWYKLYRTVQGDPSVLDAHRSFLLARDYATMLVLLIGIFVPLAIYYGRTPKPAVGLGVALVLQLGVAVRAARGHGERLVCNVLAIKSAEGNPAT